MVRRVQSQEVGKRSTLCIRPETSHTFTPAQRVTKILLIQAAKSAAGSTTTPRRERKPGYLYYDKDGKLEPPSPCSDDDEWVTVDGFDEVRADNYLNRGMTIGMLTETGSVCMVVR
jgi:hypothetical protein